MTLSGIDISHHNWSLVQSEDRQQRGWLYYKAADGFAILKATEGATWTDPRYSDYIRMIGESNIIYDYASLGIYHYARPENNTPEAEAKHFVQTIGNMAGHALLALDVEGRALSYPALDDWCLTWLQTVESMTNGVKPVIYLQKSALKLFDKVPANDFGLWLAAWTKQKPATKAVEPWPFMALWQNNGMGLDTDYFFGSKKQWLKYATGSK